MILLERRISLSWSSVLDLEEVIKFAEKTKSVIKVSTLYDNHRGIVTETRHYGFILRYKKSRRLEVIFLYYIDVEVFEFHNDSYFLKLTLST